MSTHNSHPSPPSPPTPIAVEPSRGVHVFDVANYSLHRSHTVGSFLRSSTFHVGGCAWAIRFYPRGETFRADGRSAVHVAVALELLTKDAVVTISYDMQLIDRATGARYSGFESGTAEFDTRCVERFVQTWCIKRFMRKSKLEASTYLRDDRLVIECTLRLIKGTRVPEVPAAASSEITVPPSDLPKHLGRLLKEDERADVTFLVQGETFNAHRVVLAARSPVFKAELQGPMKEGSVECIHIPDMQPAVFKALLHFVYTDSLPAMDKDVNKGDDMEMIQQLLMAAYRFGMNRMQLVCEQMLSRSLKVETVASMLVLADRHDCSGLKDACIEFIISGRMDDVARTEDFGLLKRERPSLLVEVLEKAGKLHKI